MGKTIDKVDGIIAVNLRDIRVSRQLSQSDVAETLGLTYQQVQKYEAGKNRISAGNIARLAGAWGVRVSEFYKGTNNEGRTG